MFRPASRALLRAPVAFRPAQSRLASTSAAEQPKSRSWKNTALRLGLAFGAVYYYNTSSVFTEHSFLLPKNTQPASSESTSEPTLDSIKPRIRTESQSQAQRQPQPPREGEQGGEGEEEPQEAAFNPETGEINWDCPCLGGMAHGPCGEEFKAAFSCFVYSTDEPKGMDCIDKFKGMQDCFRAHPDVYGAELDDEDDDANAAAPSPGDESKPESQDHPQSGASASAAVPATQLDASSHPAEKHSRAKEVHSQIKENPNAQAEQSESEELLPKAWHDTEEKNATKAVATEK